MRNKKTKKNISLTSSGNIIKKPLLAITGQYQNGKSTLLNCLLGDFLALEGDGCVTTKVDARYTFGNTFKARVMKTDGRAEIVQQPNYPLIVKTEYSSLEVSVNAQFLQRIDILDSPGSGANERDNNTASCALEKANFIVYVVKRALDNESDIPFLKKIVAMSKRFTVILNCYDDRDPNDDQCLSVCEEIMAGLTNADLNRNYIALSEKNAVYPVNLLWAQCALGYLDESTQNKRLRKVKSYFDGENLEQLLECSGFVQFQKMLGAHVNQFSRFSPWKPLNALQCATELLQSSMIEILDKGL